MLYTIERGVSRIFLNPKGLGRIFTSSGCSIGPPPDRSGGGPIETCERFAGQVKIIVEASNRCMVAKMSAVFFANAKRLSGHSVSLDNYGLGAQAPGEFTRPACCASARSVSRRRGPPVVPETSPTSCRVRDTPASTRYEPTRK